MNPINNIIVFDIGFKNLNKINICKIITDDIKEILIGDELKLNKHKKHTECEIYAGGYQYPGAAFLCSMAAHKTGSGYVRLYYGNLGKKENEVFDSLLGDDLDGRVQDIIRKTQPSEDAPF